MSETCWDLKAGDVKDWLSKEFPLPPQGTWPASQHRFEEDDVWAIRAALVTGRPLLLRGKPGMGKSQLARAAAEKLRVPFLSVVVDERTERDDLLLSYDSVARLAEAQIAGARGESVEDAVRSKRLSELNFVRPGALWWALNWKGASEQVDRYRQEGRTCDVPPKPQGWDPVSVDGGEPLRGPVILVDEIDKADPSVPNGLLETLANDGFEVLMPSVRVQRGKETGPPLVVITTNEERELPAAFLRRCLVYEMSFPETEPAASKFLRGRARVHHSTEAVSDEVLEVVVKQFLSDRQKASDVGGHQPGPAEFLDLLRALVEFGKESGESVTQAQRDSVQLKALEKVSRFAFAKHLKELV